MAEQTPAEAFRIAAEAFTEADDRHAAAVGFTERTDPGTYLHTAAQAAEAEAARILTAEGARYRAALDAMRAAR